MYFSPLIFKKKSSQLDKCIILYIYCTCVQVRNTISDTMSAQLKIQ